MRALQRQMSQMLSNYKQLVGLDIGIELVDSHDLQATRLERTLEGNKELCICQAVMTHDDNRTPRRHD